jgi:hypothetical protein
MQRKQTWILILNKNVSLETKLKPTQSTPELPVPCNSPVFESYANGVFAINSINQIRFEYKKCRKSVESIKKCPLPPKIIETK